MAGRRVFRGIRTLTVALMAAGLMWACASLDNRALRGTSGSVTWEVVNLQQRASADGQETRWYYTLVLRETAGRAIQFDRVQGGVYGSGIESIPREVRFDHRLNARSELRINDSASLQSRLGGLMFVAERFYGRDDTGKPVTVDIRIPLVASAGQRPRESLAPGQLPPVKNLAVEDLRRLAGTWHGHYRDDKGFETPLEMIVRDDGSFEAAEDDPPRNRFRGNLTIRDGQIVYSQANDTGTLTLHEAGGTRMLQGSISRTQEGPPSRPGATAHTGQYLIRLQSVASLPAVAAPIARSPVHGERAPGGTSLLWEVARECEGRFPAIHATEIDFEGTVHFEYQSIDDQPPFMACVRDRSREKMSGRVARPTGGVLRTSISVDDVRGRLVVAVTVNGSHQARLLLDTGSDRTVLTPALFERLGLTTEADAIRMRMTVATGETVRVPLAQIGSLMIGDFTVEDLYVGVYAVVLQMSDVDGLLGTDVLGHFRASVDRHAHQLTLEVP